MPLSRPPRSRKPSRLPLPNNSFPSETPRNPGPRRGFFLCARSGELFASLCFFRSCQGLRSRIAKDCAWLRPAPVLPSFPLQSRFALLRLASLAFLHRGFDTDAFSKYDQSTHGQKLDFCGSFSSRKGRRRAVSQRNPRLGVSIPAKATAKLAFLSTPFRRGAARSLGSNGVRPACEGSKKIENSKRFFRIGSPCFRKRSFNLRKHRKRHWRLIWTHPDAWRLTTIGERVNIPTRA